MELNNYLGCNIADVFSSLINDNALISYEKIENDEFIELPEKGFYFQAKNGTGIISDFRIFLTNHEKYLAATSDVKGSYKNLVTLEDFEKTFGSAIREVKAIKIPSCEPTLPGKIFIHNGKLITAYFMDNSFVAYIHVKLKP
jgi:hypothetical protein